MFTAASLIWDILRGANIYFGKYHVKVMELFPDKVITTQLPVLPHITKTKLKKWPDYTCGLLTTTAINIRRTPSQRNVTAKCCGLFAQCHPSLFVFPARRLLAPEAATFHRVEQKIDGCDSAMNGLFRHCLTLIKHMRGRRCGTARSNLKKFKSVYIWEELITRQSLMHRYWKLLFN